ncbi:MAG: FHA domain-containing protein [Phycisphaerae bacterium]|nr:FHA domain-containing protein [Phycisphaerae bacterium]NUQ48028.1 FHA domain-containing protein [Phycisphaerae bacterium]
MAVVLELTFAEGPQAGNAVQVAPDVAVIGRSAAADVPLDDPAASRQHARLRRTGDAYEIENLSPNGTLVNGAPVESRPLREGDVIQIGAATRLKVRYLVRSGAVVAYGAAGDAGGNGAAFDDSEPPPPAAPVDKPSLLRRPKVIIGLAVYFLAVLIVFLMLETGRPRVEWPNGLGRREIAEMMERYFAADSPAFERSPNAAREREALDRARQAIAIAPVSARSLWAAAVAYRDAIAYSAQHTLHDADDARNFRKARADLADKLADLYIRALAEQRKGRLTAARDRFNTLRQVVSDPRCPLHEHVGRWLAAINTAIAE